MADLPRRIPATGGEVTLASERDVFLYENFKFAAARRAGNVLYVSGVIAGPEKGEARDLDGFKAQLRRAWTTLGATLAAAGARFDQVAMINSFHIWQGPNFEGSARDQLTAFIAVKDEFIKEPHPAWTAVGTTGLALDTGIVEIQLIAHL
ncbi:MAG: RidA family protein [Alphaproteobacteria bacterium]|nr:RidA family protein [Alphaproteobacteria bacterium]